MEKQQVSEIKKEAKTYGFKAYDDEQVIKDLDYLMSKYRAVVFNNQSNLFRYIITRFAESSRIEDNIRKEEEQCGHG